MTVNQEYQRYRFIRAEHEAARQAIAQSDAARGVYTLRQAERDALKILSRPAPKGVTQA